MFTYLYKRESHSDTSADYMNALGIDEETQESILAQAQYEQIANFKANRQAQLDRAIVTTASGKQFDADEPSIIRLGNALVAADGEPDTTIIKWSLANDGAGVMTDCTKAEIKEAHRFAMENMSAIWSV